jgi:hypothetical protein
VRIEGRRLHEIPAAALAGYRIVDQDGDTTLVSTGRYKNIPKEPAKPVYVFDVNRGRDPAFLREFAWVAAEDATSLILTSSQRDTEVAVSLALPARGVSTPGNFARLHCSIVHASPSFLPARRH